MSKIYVSATFARMMEARQIAERLIAEGHEITSTWVYQVLPNQNNPVQPGKAKEYGDRDLEETLKSTLLIQLTGDPKDIVPTGGGRHIEFGIALAKQIPIIIIGPRENVFHHIEGVMVVASVYEAINCLQVIA